MKTKLFILAAFLLSLGVRAQVINSTHAFAVGTPESVTIQWDAFGDEAILGCLIYKRLTQFEPLHLLTPVMLTSEDSRYSFTDEGEFDSAFPPEYSIYAINNSDSVLLHEFTGFKSIEFEVLDSTRVNMVLHPWNSEECCASVKIFQNETFMVDAGYDEYFQMIIDMNILPPGDYYKFMLMSGHPELYARLTVTWAYLNYLSHSLGLEDKPLQHILSQNTPNPFSTETIIRFDLKEKALVSLDVYSLDGRRVESLINNTLMPGLQSFNFSKGNLKPGVYLYRLTTGKEVSVRRMVVN